MLITTHSPLPLSYLDDPDAVRIVRRSASDGTTVARPDDPDAVRKALEECGFGLGESYETAGFGT